MTENTLLELRELLDSLCEESITAERMARLEALILADPEAEALYVQFMSMHADLHRHFGADSPANQRLRQHAASMTAMPATSDATAIARPRIPAKLRRRAMLVGV